MSIEVRVRLECVWCDNKAEGWATLNTCMSVAAEMNPISEVPKGWNLSWDGTVWCDRHDSVGNLR